MLPGICPGCGLKADLDVFAIQAGVPQAIVAALNLPPALSGRVLPYLRLFAPPKKSLAMSKLARLLAELSDAVTKAEVKRNGTIWVAPLGLWQSGMDIVIQQPPERLPLDSHAYLFQVVANLAAKAAGREERAEEAHQKNSRRFQPTQPGLRPASQIIRSEPETAPAPAPAPAPVRFGPPPNWLADTKDIMLKKKTIAEVTDETQPR